MNRLFLTIFMLLSCLGISAQVTVTFDDPPEKPLTELPAQMNFSFSEPLEGNPPTVYIKSATQEKKLTCTRPDPSNYQNYMIWVSYYVKGDLLAEIQEAGEFSICITLNDGTELDPVVFKLKKPITVTFDNDPETMLEELPAQMNFSFSEPLEGNPPTVYIKSATQEKKLTCTRPDPSNYQNYMIWVSYYVKGDLLAEIQEAGEFSICITLNDGTELDPVVFKLKKPITVTFDNDPETVLEELPGMMYFTLSEPMNGNPPTVYIKSKTQEKKLTVSRDGNNYARYYAWVSYYVKGDLLAEILEDGEFSLCITLIDGTELAPVVFKVKNPNEPYTAVFADQAGSVFAGMPEEIHFTLSKDAGDDTAVKAIVNGTREIACHRDGDSARGFHILAAQDIPAEEYADGRFSVAVNVADAEEPAAEAAFFTVPSEIGWTPAQGNEDGSLFSSLPTSLAYTLSSALPEGCSVETGIVLAGSDDASLIAVPCTVSGTDVNFDMKGIAADDIARIEQNEEFAVALRLANKTLSASYTVKPRKGSVTLGYCTDELPSEMQKLGSEGAATTVGAAIRIPAAKLEALKGGSITRIRFAMDEGLERVYAWIRPSLSEPAIAMKKVETEGKGWHEVELDAPYTITGDEIFIGYSGHQPAGVKAILAGGPDRPDACWLGIKNNWEDRSASGYGSLYIQAIGEATLPSTDLGVDNLALDRQYYKSGETAKASFSLFNSGADEIKGYTVSWKIDDAEPQTVSVNEPLATDSRSDRSFDIPLAGLADGIHTLTVDCAVTDNGREDQVADNNSAAATVAVYTDSFSRTVLLEQFTTTSCINCPKGSATLKVATEGRDDIAWLAHHVGFGVDELTVDESSALLDFGVPGAPSLMVDRTVMEGSCPPFGIGYSNAEAGGQRVREYIDRCAAVPAFAGISLENEFDEASRELTVTVRLERNAIFSTFFPECNFSVFLTEDNIRTKRQQAGATGEYLHDHAVRQFLTPAFGQPVDWAGEDSFTMKRTVVLDKEWKAYDMHIVAALNKPFDAADPVDAQVINAAVCKVDAENGVGSVYDDAGLFTDADGAIRGEGLSGIEVFTPAGVRVENRALAKGLYIVRATAAGGKAVTVKTCVR